MGSLRKKIWEIWKEWEFEFDYEKGNMKERGGKKIGCVFAHARTISFFSLSCPRSLNADVDAILFFLPIAHDQDILREREIERLRRKHTHTKITLTRSTRS